MKVRLTALGAIAATLWATTAIAGPIPYPNAGTENPTTYNFTASTTGDLSAYFTGSGAAYSEYLGLLVNGVDSGINGLQNHTTPVGTQLDFGNVTAGDTLTFYIKVNGAHTYYSDPALNVDGENHVYSTSYAGGSGIPAGTYVGFEDLSLTFDPYSDFNYGDEQFVFTNTSTMTSSVPEPTSRAMMLAGFGALGAAMRLRRKEATAIC